MLSSLSLGFFALVALACFTAPAAKAEEPHSEYGTVIGIGKLNSSLYAQQESDSCPI